MTACPAVPLPVDDTTLNWGVPNGTDDANPSDHAGAGGGGGGDSGTGEGLGSVGAGDSTGGTTGTVASP